MDVANGEDGTAFKSERSGLPGGNIDGNGHRQRC
jgi:hypothetical protein